MILLLYNSNKKGIEVTMLFNKNGDALITISEATKKGSDKFDNISSGHVLVVDSKLYPEIVNKDTAYYKADDLGVDPEDIE